MSKLRSLEWNPDEITLIRMKDIDYYTAFKAFRKSSTGYVNKKYVREFVFNKYKNRCLICHSEKELQIDHIKSVHECFKNKELYYCNSIENLQLLCSECNNKKSNRNV